MYPATQQLHLYKYTQEHSYIFIPRDTYKNVPNSKLCEQPKAHCQESE